MNPLRAAAAKAVAVGIARRPGTESAGHSVAERVLAIVQHEAEAIVAVAIAEAVPVVGDWLLAKFEIGASRSPL